MSGYLSEEVDYEEDDFLDNKPSDNKSDEKPEKSNSSPTGSPEEGEEIEDNNPHGSSPMEVEDKTLDNKSSEKAYDPFDGWSPSSEETKDPKQETREQALAEIPGYRPDRYPWTIFNANALPRKDGMNPVKWIAKFLKWRSARKKRAVDRDTESALRASWSTFSSKALFEGLEGVDNMIEKALDRAKHDAQYSASGIKQAVHDLCKARGIACHVLLYENVCNDCGWKDLKDPEFQKPIDIAGDYTLASKLQQYGAILRDRGVDWRSNYDSNIRAGHPERLATASNEVPRSHAPAYIRANARDNISRGNPFVDRTKYDSHVRESIQQSTAPAHVNPPRAAVAFEQSLPDASFASGSEGEEERDFALQNYDPEEKLRRYQSMVSKRLDRYEKTVATLENCVGAFAVSLKQATDRLSRLERELKNRVDAQDSVLKSQHLRIQELETWRLEQRRAASKRAREEAAESAKRAREATGEQTVPLGAMQTHRKNESLKRSGSQPDRE